MKTRRLLSLVLSLILALPLSLAVAAPASAGVRDQVTYELEQGNYVFDPTTATIVDCTVSRYVTDLVVPGQLGGVQVKRIDRKVFSGCDNLVTVTLPAGLMEIGDGAFGYCDNLTSINIPYGVTKIGAEVFSNCPKLASISLPDTVTEVGNDLFLECTSLSSVRLSRNLKVMSNRMFKDCAALTSIDIPDSVYYIGQECFRDTGLTSLSLSPSVNYIGKGVFYSCDDLVWVDLSQTTITEDRLGDSVFYDCPSLVHVSLPAGLERIYGYTFALCTALESLSIPEGVTEIWEGAFGGCSSLRTLILPSTLESVGMSCCSGNDNMTIYFRGTMRDWGVLDTSLNNGDLLNASIHFAQSVAGFTDVADFDYYADAVQWAVNAGVTTGTGANTFSPSAAVTRAQAVTFLWRAAGSPEPVSASSPFTDVTDPSAYYYKAVLWAAEQGITGGVGNNAFGLDNTLTYDQIFTFLCRAAGDTADGADWSAAAVNWANANGLTDGLFFDAKLACPRCDLVYCLWKQMV